MRRLGLEHGYIIGHLAWREEGHWGHAGWLAHHWTVNYGWREGKLARLRRLPKRYGYRTRVLVRVKPSQRYYVCQTLNLDRRHLRLRRLVAWLSSRSRPIYLLVALLTVVLIAVCLVLLVYL